MDVAGWRERVIKTFGPDFEDGCSWYFIMNSDTLLEFPLNIRECKGAFYIKQDAAGGRKLEISNKYSMPVDGVDIKYEPHSMSVLFFVSDCNGVKIVGV